MVDHRVIAVLLLEGRSYREIAAVQGCSQRAVARVRKVLVDRGITAAGLAGVAEDEWAGWFPDGRAKVSDGYEAPDFDRVLAAMRRNRHYTLLQGWRAYVEGKSVLRKYGYTRNCPDHRGFWGVSAGAGDPSGSVS